MSRAPRGMGAPMAPSPGLSKDASLTTAFASGARDGLLGSLRGQQGAAVAPQRPAEEASSSAPAETKPVPSPAPPEAPVAPEELPRLAEAPAKPKISAYQRARDQLDQKLEARGLNGPVRSEEIDLSR